MTTEERNKKIEENLKLVSHSLALLKVQWNEDYFQQGVLELIRCVENYDENKGYKFSTYAIKCITLKLKDYIKRDFVLKPKLTDMKKGNVYAPPVVSLTNIVHNIPGDKPIMLQDIIPSEVNWKDIDLKADIENLINKKIITKEEFQLLMDIEVNGYSIRNLSKKYNLSNKQIKQKIEQIKKTLRENLSYNYFEGG